MTLCVYTYMFEALLSLSLPISMFFDVVDEDDSQQKTWMGKKKNVEEMEQVKKYSVV